MKTMSGINKRMKFLMKGVVAVAAVVTLSCSPQYPQRATYELANGYGDAKAKLTGYHDGQNHSFHLFRDESKGTSQEISPGNKTAFAVKGWAPDIGGYTHYEAILTRKGSGSVLQAICPLARGVAYDVPRAISGDKLGGMSDLDKWVTANLKVKSRVLDEDKSSRSIP